MLKTPQNPLVARHLSPFQGASYLSSLLAGPPAVAVPPPSEQASNG